LAHSIQQSRGGTPPTIDSNGPLERHADDAAEQFARGAEHVSVSGASGPGVARQDARAKREPIEQPIFWRHMRGPEVLEAKRKLNLYQQQEREAGRQAFGKAWRPLKEDDFVRC